MEPRAVVASPLSGNDEITLWSSTQIPHVLRVLLSLSTGIPQNKLRVVAPDVGGGFGSKLQFYREEILAIVLCQKLGKPVKWTESRSENIVATHHGRDQIQDIQLAVKRDGTILGMKIELLANMGAYLQLLTPGIPVLGQFMFNGIYKMDAYDWTAPACSPRPRRRTHTAAPADRRRRTRSSASSTRPRSSSAWSRWSSGGRTGSSTRSSRTRPSPG